MVKARLRTVICAAVALAGAALATLPAGLLIYGAQADHPEGPNRMAQWATLDQRLQQAKAQKLGCYSDKVK